MHQDLVFLIGDGRFFGERQFLASNFGIFLIGAGNVDWDDVWMRLDTSLVWKIDIYGAIRLYVLEKVEN